MAYTKVIIKEGVRGLWGVALVATGLILFFLLPGAVSRGGEKGFVNEARAQCSFSGCGLGETACEQGANAGATGAEAAAGGVSGGAGGAESGADASCSTYG